MCRRLMTWLVALAVATSFFASLRVLVTRDVFSSSLSLASAMHTHAVSPSSLAVRELADAPPSLRLRWTPERAAAAAVLLPDWEALLLLPKAAAEEVGPAAATCVFHNGATSRARLAGAVPSTGLSAFRCVLPRSVRRLRPFYSPRLVAASAAASQPASGVSGSPEMVRWARVVYEAVSTANDVIVFAKGINSRAGSHRAAADLRCVYSSLAGDLTAAASATSSAQEVFRCPHPPPEAAAFSPLRISLAIAGDETPLPTLATYTSPPPKAETQDGRALVCACTMVYNAAKFLSEWVAYHAAVGVERFFLYDNGSHDDLHSLVTDLTSRGGYNISTRFWPWPKTQEAGFSHCAAVHAAECQWMAFIDVDEFVFATAWSRSAQPDKSMIRSLVAVEPVVGQVVVGCHEFGPSGRKAHPKAGVTQGYTCRKLNESRHKSLVRLDAVHRSLLNSVHHFWLKDGFTTAKAGFARVNHYKYQAWPEFKVKFRRRVSAYVADWTDAVNVGSRDRTPGLGFSAVEPAGWDQMFCEVNDTRLGEATRRWFRVALPGTGRPRMMWQAE